ncbi:hypothetical protein SMG44B_10879 [Stenotrophomonas maltophilia]
MLHESTSTPFVNISLARRSLRKLLIYILNVKVNNTFRSATF